MSLRNHKIISNIIILGLIVILSGLFSFVVAKPKASDCQKYCGDQATYDEPDGVVCVCSPIKHTSIEALIEAIVGYIGWIAIAMAPLLIIWAAYNFATAAGDPEKIKRGKKIIIWTFIGLLVMVFSKGIMSIIKDIFDVT